MDEFRISRPNAGDDISMEIASFLAALLSGAVSALLGGCLAYWGSWSALKATWVREDRLRSYDHRREAYVAFMREWRSLYFRMEDPNFPGGDEAGDLFDQLDAVYLFGTSKGYEKAQAAYQELMEWTGDRSREPDIESGALAVFRSQVRHDLGVPDHGLGDDRP